MILFFTAIFLTCINPILSFNCLTNKQNITCVCNYTISKVTCNPDNTCIGLICYKTLKIINSVSYLEDGCISHHDSDPDTQSPNFQCSQSQEYIKSLKHQTDCCCTDGCNEFLDPRLNHTEAPTPTHTPVYTTLSSNLILGISIGVPISVLLVFLLLILLITVYFCSGRSSINLFKPAGATRLRQNDCFYLHDINNIVEWDSTLSSGSGSGLPFLQPRTVAKEIQLLELVGQGRFGRVHRGIWRGDFVAVKIFFTLDEKSWFRETDIYNTVLLRHDNILTCLGSDMISKDGVTELWLVTHYHPNGSLYDYLNEMNVELNISTFRELALSAVNGLVHLHWDISGTHNKPAMAHRDLKSKNLLVKNNHTICIADFGMAVRDQNQRDLEEAAHNIKQGTNRYMAPEILGETIDTSSFDSYRRVDIYCFGLVIWELTQKLKHRDEGVDVYQIPYHAEVPSDPTFEDMREIVFVQKKRPHPNERLFNLPSILQLMQECWYQDPVARLTSLRVKNTLTNILSHYTNDL